MVSFKSFILSFATAIAIVNAYNIPRYESKRDEPKVLKLDFNVSKAIKGSKERYDYNDDISHITTNLTRIGYFYSVNLTIGSQNTVVCLDLDTGSSDLWVLASNVTDGFILDEPILRSGTTFDITQSTTYTDTLTSFWIFYLDGTFAYGEYVIDNVGIPDGPTINVQFGLAVVAVLTHGIFGIGPESVETSPSEYPNFPVVLKNEGYISKVAYSLYLNAANASSGSLLFGGIDSAKYEGSLTKLPMDPYLAGFYVNGTGITVGNVTVSGLSEPLLLDSGTALVYLPDDYLQAVYQGTGAVKTEYGYKVDLPDDFTLDFNFQNCTVKVNIADLSGPAHDHSGNKLDYNILLIDSGNILGDSFLRSAYVAYDLEDEVIYLGQVKYTDDSNIIAFP